MRSEGAPLSRTPNTFAPGSWEPGRFRLSDAFILKGTLVLMALARGFDYITPPPRLTQVTETMMLAFPLEVWGGAFLALAVTLAAGMALRIHFLVWLGHGLLAAAYVAVFVSLSSVYLQREMFEGIRSATVVLAPLVLHGLLSCRTGWRPPNWGVDADE